MSDLPAPAPKGPDDEVTESERQVMVRQIQLAMSREELRFDEIDERFAAIYAATTRAELDKVVADLPEPPAPLAPPPGHPVARQTTAILGDVKVGGWIDAHADMNYGTIFGDIVVDLSSASLPEEVTVSAWNVFGDTVVILPDGVRASMEGFVGLGDRKVDLADPRHGAPVVTVKIFKIAGDAKLFSLSRVPEGRFRKLWRKLRE